MQLAYQKQKGHENFVLIPRVIFEVTSYQTTYYPNLFTQNNKRSVHHTSPSILPPTPHRCLTLRQARRVLHVLQVRVASEAEAPEATAQEW
jgi:hypothetical protein